MKRISAKQEQILAFIEKSTQDHGYPPSVREIGEAVGLRSPSTVHTHLKTLSQNGLINKDDRKTRALALPGRDAQARGGVPILGVVTAGLPILANEEDNGLLPYSPQGGGEHFALQVTGDSMINAGILDGDFVVVRKQPTARNNQIVVALLEDEATVKRFRKEDGVFRLIAENPAYKPIVTQNCKILGIVVSVVRERVH